MAERVTAEPQSEPFTFAQQALFAIFFGSPREQMVYSVIAATVAYVTTLLSFGATAIFVILFSITFLIGLTRFLFQVVTS